MNFLLPLAWLWLLALIPVVVLHFLRRKERDWPVSALFLWEGVRPDRPHFVQRLRRRFDLLLLLQMLGVVLLAFALSHPVFFTTKPSGATLLILDGSAAVAASGTAEEIVAQAKRVLAESAGPWAAILWASPPQLLCGSTSSRAELLQALAQYEPTLTKRPELSQALALFPEPWPRVVVITDDPQGVEGTEVVEVERPENLGITAFAVRPSPDGVRYEAFLRVLNATRKFQDVQVRVRTEAGEFWTSRLVPPAAEEEVVLPLSGVRTQVFTAELLPSDAFPWDNVRYFAFSSAEVRVAWQGQDDRYLWAALRAGAPVVRVDGDADLLIAAYADLSGEPVGPAFFLAAGGPSCPRGALREAGPLRGTASSLLTHVSLEKFRIANVYEIRLPQEAEVVIWAGEFPLLALWNSPYGRRVILAADLASSNLPLLPDFPVLVRNLLGWLLPEEPAPLAVVGESVRLPEGFQLLLDSETVEDVWVPDKPGIFVLRRPKGAGYLAVNVPWEASYPPALQAKSERQVFQAQVAVELWPWVLFSLVPLLLGEAVLFYRRGG